MPQSASLSNKPLARKLAVVTGASSGVGRSIALALAEAGADVALLGRRITLLRAVAKKCIESGSRAACYKVDLLNERKVYELKKQVTKTLGEVDILVHSAGVIARANVATASSKEFDWQYQSNVRAPFALTRLFLPALTERKGHIVFINSTVGLVGAAGVSQYAATKHALRAFADSLREELNPHGVRVLSVFLGRTATPMQAKVHQWEGKSYTPERLVQPQQVASVVIGALVLGPEAEVTDIRIRPTIKAGTPQ
ncbi:MAG: SDR family oxidoreductase [Pyrinomonadaceae bacterium]